MRYMTRENDEEAFYWLFFRLKGKMSQVFNFFTATALHTVVASAADGGGIAVSSSL